MSRRLGSVSDTLFRGSFLSLLFHSCGYHFWVIGVSASLLVEALVSSLIFSVFCSNLSEDHP